MQITIGQTTDDRRTVQKSFTGTDITAKLKNPCDILHPVFILTWSSSYVHDNYVYAPDLGNYYYIDKVILLTDNKAEIQCRLDISKKFFFRRS